MIKAEIEKGLTNIVNRFTGEVKDQVVAVVADINTVLGQMITNPENADQQAKNLDILYGNLSTIASIEKEKLRKEIAKTVTSILTKTTTTIILAL